MTVQYWAQQDVGNQKELIRSCTKSCQNSYKSYNLQLKAVFWGVSFLLPYFAQFLAWSPAWSHEQIATGPMRTATLPLVTLEFISMLTSPSQAPVIEHALQRSHRWQIRNVRRSLSRHALLTLIRALVAVSWTTATQFWSAWQEHCSVVCNQYLTPWLDWCSQPGDRNT